MQGDLLHYLVGQMAYYPYPIYCLPPSSDKGSEITPNVSDNSNNISPSAAGGNNKIPDGSITTSKLADGAVTTPKIADQSVTASKIAGLNKLLFGTCTTSYTDQSSAVDLFCSFPGVEEGDRIIVTAHKFTDETSNTPFGCGVVSSATVYQPDTDTLQIGIGNICAPQHTITVTFAMISYHEK